MFHNMPCHITDGPSDPEDAGWYTEERWLELERQSDYYNPEERTMSEEITKPESTASFQADVMSQLDAIWQQLGNIQIIRKATEEKPLTELYTALAAAQGEIQNAEANTENEFIGKRYANLAAVLDAIRGPFSKHGLSIIQYPTPAESPGTLGLRTILAHESGQSIETYYEMSPPKLDPQGIGSCMTYMRRYAAMAMAGIAGALDDDAERTKVEAPKITPAEADAILNLADELFGDDADALLDRMCAKIFDCDSVPQIPQGQAEVAMQRIRNTKARKDREAAAKKKAPSAKPPEDDA